MLSGNKNENWTNEQLGENERKENVNDHEVNDTPIEDFNFETVSSINEFESWMNEQLGEKEKNENDNNHEVVKDKPINDVDLEMVSANENKNLMNEQIGEKEMKENDNDNEVEEIPIKKAKLETVSSVNEDNNLKNELLAEKEMKIIDNDHEVEEIPMKNDGLETVSSVNENENLTNEQLGEEELTENDNDHEMEETKLTIKNEPLVKNLTSKMKKRTKNKLLKSTEDFVSTVPIDNKTIAGGLLRLATSSRSRKIDVNQDAIVNNIKNKSKVKKLSPKKKPPKNVPKKKIKIDVNQDSIVYDIKNKSEMKKLSPKIKPPKIVPKKKIIKIIPTRPPGIRCSRRQANLPLLTESDYLINKTSEFLFDKDFIPIPKDDSEYFEKLGADLVIQEAVNDFHTCDFTKFTNVVKSLETYETPLIGKSYIYSLAVHPSETSLIIASGDMKGNVALFNRSNHITTNSYQVSDTTVNCLSFCTWDSNKLFSTSYDGSVRCGDIDKCTFDTIYTTQLWIENQTKKCRWQRYYPIQTTWHTEYERNLLIANGSGHVNLIDIRTPNTINYTVRCHQKSVRTVQCHPLEKHYFITSSVTGEASLWDTRNMTDNTINPVLQFERSTKPLTSAFFSSSGTRMVSTSNDELIKLYNTSKLITESTKPEKKIEHSNSANITTGFKAKWNPGRDDAFFIGSLQIPKRVQIYRSDGNLLFNLTSPNMQTFCPIIEAHPTQAIYVAGNSSGRIHIFSTKDQFAVV